MYMYVVIKFNKVLVDGPCLIFFNLENFKIYQSIFIVIINIFPVLFPCNIFTLAF